MFEYKIPRFAELRIFTREILFSMRDLLWKEQQLAYADYSSGIITGCGLVEKDGLIGVNRELLNSADGCICSKSRSCSPTSLPTSGRC